MLKKILIFWGASFFVSLGLSAQISVTNTMTPAQLVQNILLGSGVDAMNIKYNGSTVNAGIVQPNVTQFGSSGSSFPIVNGVLLTTGAGSIASGPNDSEGASDETGTSVIIDSDLSSIATDSISNGAIIEFDFVASGDSVSFSYLFASEEYPEFSPSTFNDAFGFFLSGPGIIGPYSGNGVNLAVLPTTLTSTNVVTINNVNPTTNPQYFVDNQDGSSYGDAIQYDGSTVQLTARHAILCGQLYHIKLCIANVADMQYDSGVFLQAGSFAIQGPSALVIPDTLVDVTPATFVFQNGSQNATNYSWDFGNSSTAITTELSSQTSFYPVAGTYTVQLVAYLGTCSDTGYVTITVIDPTVDPTNVFTPNGDDVNDSFQLKVTNMSNVNIIITNRWGEVMFTGSGPDPKWDGYCNNKLASDGVYYYIYEAVGKNGGEVFKGQGFLHLISGY